jgi:hypothetical protein
VDPRADLDDVDRIQSPLPRLELGPFGCPARSQRLYQLRYPGSRVGKNINFITYNIEIIVQAIKEICLEIQNRQKLNIWA